MENLGYVKSINKAIIEAKNNDVILLNSDTIVTNRWLNKLVIAAYSNDKIATVTAVSNSAGVFSVPNIGENEIPNNLTIDKMARLVKRISDNK